MNHRFEQFCQDYLGDAGVYDTFNQRYLLKKTQNYYHAWQRATHDQADFATAKDFARQVLTEIDDSYEIGEKMVTIDRSRHYELIYEFCRS